MSKTKKQENKNNIGSWRQTRKGLRNSGEENDDKRRRRHSMERRYTQNGIA